MRANCIRWNSAAAIQMDISKSESPSQQRITFYRRELPDNLVSFTSDHGKRLFRESLAQGYAENYFHLVGNFTSQSEPAFCGLGSLAMALNALEIDPGKTWKGIWRWYTDDNLECCASALETIKQKGITYREFACLARCNGLAVTSKRADAVSRDEFVCDLERVCSSNDQHMVVSFSRRALKQTGDGHFSPVGAFNKESSKVLILDTARFKYPSYFADVDELYEAMKPIDKDTGLPRGYFILSRNCERKLQPYKPLSLCQLTKSLGIPNPKLARLFCHELPQRLLEKNPSTMEHAIKLLLSHIPAKYSALISFNDPRDVVDLAGPEGTHEDFVAKHRLDILDLLEETRNNPLFPVVDRVMLDFPISQNNSNAYPSHVNTALATIFMLAAPREIFRTLNTELLIILDQCRDTSRMSELMRAEVARIGDQLSSLMNDYCTCAVKTTALSQLPSMQLRATKKDT